MTKPFGYFHELLDGTGQANGIWLGCDDKQTMENSYIKDQTGTEIVALFVEDKWISTKDSLPEGYADVFVWFSQSDVAGLKTGNEVRSNPHLVSHWKYANLTKPDDLT